MKVVECTSRDLFRFCKPDFDDYASFMRYIDRCISYDDGVSVICGTDKEITGVVLGFFVSPNRIHIRYVRSTNFKQLVRLCRFYAKPYYTYQANRNGTLLDITELVNRILYGHKDSRRKQPFSLREYYKVFTKAGRDCDSPIWANCKN